MPFSSCVGICSKRTPLKVFPTESFHSGGYNLDTKPWLLLSGWVSFDSNFLCFHMTTVYCTFLPLCVNYSSFFTLGTISFHLEVPFTSHFKARCCSHRQPILKDAALRSDSVSAYWNRHNSDSADLWERVPGAVASPNLSCLKGSRSLCKCAALPWFIL